jgi:hypothetical protein
MKNDESPLRPVHWFWFVVATMLSFSAFLLPSEALAQVPARFYWKNLSNSNGVPVIVQSVSGNTNPFDHSAIVTPGANFDVTLALVGYARTFSLHNRATMFAILAPMGRISGDVTDAGRTTKQSAAGFGDPMFEFDINLHGPRAQKLLPDAIRYQPGFSIDLLGDLALPIGHYDSKQSLNLGQNRWYGRIGAPIVWQLGPWVPGRRTTLEFLPTVWLFAENNDFVGKTLKSDPLFQLDGHFTRDLTENFWAAFDTVWFAGGKATIDGVAGENRNNLGLGLTAGYKINDNLGLTFGYKSTINDSAPDALRLNQFSFSLVYGWNSVVEGMNRLKHE